MPKYRPWLRDIALWFDGFRTNRQAKEIIRRRLTQLGEVTKRRVRSRRFSEDLFPLRRAMNPSEEFELVAAIHDGICEDTWKVVHLFPFRDGTWRNRGSEYAGVGVAKWAGRLDQITDDHFNQVREAVEAVAKGLGVEAPRLMAPKRTTRKIVKECVIERHFVPIMSSKASAKTPKRPRRSRRGKAKVMTKRQEAVVIAREGTNQSWEKIGSVRGTSAQAAQQLYERAKNSSDYKQRSTNLRKAKSLNANTRPART